MRPSMQTRMINKSRIGKVAFLLWLGACTTTVAAVEVRLRERVVTNSPLVRLGDVADLTLADNQQRELLAAITVMPAPAPGTQRFVSRQTIEELLVVHGVEPWDVRFTGSSQVTIERASEINNTPEGSQSNAVVTRLNRHAAILAGQAEEATSIKLEEARAKLLREELNRLITAYLNTKCDDVGQWRVGCEVADRHLAVLNAATSPPVCSGGAAPWTGRQRFLVSFQTRNGATQIPVYADVAIASRPIVVAARPVERGAIITAADVELRNTDLTASGSLRRPAIVAVGDAIGMEVRHAIRAGEPLFLDQLRSPVVVKRGEVITVTSQAGGIRVRTTARARQDAAVGELVQVESLETRERYDVRVTGPREATILAVVLPLKPSSNERRETARR